MNAPSQAAIMGLRDIVTSGRHFIGSKLRFDANVDANVFELTIRVLGGLLSMYDLERDRVDGDAHVYLHRARELGDMLLTAFNSSWSGVPLSSYNFVCRE